MVIVTRVETGGKVKIRFHVGEKNMKKFVILKNCGEKVQIVSSRTLIL